MEETWKEEIILEPQPHLLHTLTKCMWHGLKQGKRGPYIGTLGRFCNQTPPPPRNVGNVVELV